jgi:hypothetical protein
MRRAQGGRLSLSKKARREAERERLKALPEGDLIEMRATLSKEVRMLVGREGKKHLIPAHHEYIANAGAPRLTVVTDHAVVRYLERVNGLDLEGVLADDHRDRAESGAPRRRVRRSRYRFDRGSPDRQRLSRDVMDKGSAARRPKAGEDTI